MFYSHDILSNNQYGVSTIWLVATVGKTSHRRMSRKAIQDVNVPKACETIIDPGAPLALRLQGNLLYGVSRVFAQQCHYVLSDATKTQFDLLTVFRSMKTSELDPRAGKAKRNQITLQDDPSFDVMNMLPNFDLFNKNKELTFVPSQPSAQSLSQMTPLSQGTLSSGGNPSLIPFSLPSSSRSVGNYHLPSDLVQESPLSRPFASQGASLEFNPFADDYLDPVPGIDLNFDGEGNLMGMDEPEPELPPLPETEMQEMGFFGHGIEIPRMVPGKHKGFLTGDNVIIVGEDALPDAEPFPQPPRIRKPSTTSSSSLSNTSSSSATLSEMRAVAPLRRGRPPKTPQMVDEIDQISRKLYRTWTMDYVENMEARRKKPRTSTPAQARKNAQALLFGNGIARIGAVQPTSGVAHPLAKHFAGDALKASL